MPTQTPAPAADPTALPTPWLIVAGGSQALTELRPELKKLGKSGHRVALAYAGSTVPQGVPRSRHRLLTHERVGRVRTKGVTTRLTTAVPPTVRVRLGGRLDRWLANEARRAQTIVLLDEPAAPLAERLAAINPHAQIWRPDQARQVLREAPLWQALLPALAKADALPNSAPRSLAEVVRQARRLVAAGEDPVLAPGDVRPQLRRQIRWLTRHGRLAQAQVLLQLAERVARSYGPSAREDAALAALDAVLRLAGEEEVERPVPELVADVLALADEALTREELAEAAELGQIALSLLFHQQLHAAVHDTPLVSGPDAFLAPLRGSRLGRLLAAGTRTVGTAGDTEAAPGGQADRPLRVVTLPGTYAHHAAPLLDALDEHPGVEQTVVRLDTSDFRGMAVDIPLLQHRLEHALHGRSTVPLELPPDAEETVAGADVVVADWADKGCVWASTVVRPGTRMVVRVHSIDTLSAPMHLVDWSVVTDLVFVSDHVRDVCLAILGKRIDHVRLHVVTNIVPRENFPDESLPEASRTLGIVGWAQPVKDPLFALDVLELLRQDDPTWRLRLIGADFTPQVAVGPQRVVQEFRERVLDPALVGAVDFTGFTRDLPRHLRHVGFILSTSLRESCPVGALEGTAAGAYPVIRDWPTFAPVRGAGRMFPPECVVQTPEEAARRIRELADEEDRRRAVDHVHHLMEDRFSDTQTRGQLLRIITGEP